MKTTFSELAIGSVFTLGDWELAEKYTKVSETQLISEYETTIDTPWTMNQIVYLVFAPGIAAVEPMTEKKNVYLYKLTDQNRYTRQWTRWGRNVTHTASGEGDRLCTDGVIHAYRSPLVAVLMNPAHANFESPRLWLAVGDVVIDDGTKCGVKTLTTLHPMPLPRISKTQNHAFGVLCALEVAVLPFARQWLTNWLADIDRTAETAAHVAAVLEHLAVEPAAWMASTVIGSISPALKHRPFVMSMGDAAVYANNVATLQEKEFDIVAIAQKCLEF